MLDNVEFYISGILLNNVDFRIYFKQSCKHFPMDLNTF